MNVPLIFRHGSAETVFNVAVGAWLVFEFMMRIRQGMRASGAANRDPSEFILIPSLVASVIGSRLARPGGHRRRRRRLSSVYCRLTRCRER
jgi:hypothetical protein